MLCFTPINRLYSMLINAYTIILRMETLYTILIVIYRLSWVVVSLCLQTQTFGTSD